MNSQTQNQPTGILKASAAIVPTCLSLLALLGAHSLTGSWLLAVPLAAVVPLQWAAAKRAMLAAQDKKFVKASALLVIWLIMAGVTVPLTGAELYTMLGANNQAQARVTHVLTDVHAAASKTATHFVALDNALASMESHAEEKAKQEEFYGGSCGAAFGKGIGNINRFRNGEMGWAANLRTQLAQPLGNIKQSTKDVLGLTYDSKTSITEFQRELTVAVSEINALKANSLWSNLSSSVSERVEAGKTIEMPKGSLPVNCQDPARSQLLMQLDLAAKAIAAAPEISTKFNLLDPNNHKDITMAALVRTWVWLSSPLPRAMQIRLSSDMASQYSIDPKEAFELSAGNMPLALAWVLEGIALLLVFFMKDQSAGTVTTRLAGVGLAKLQARAPWLTDWVDALQPQKPMAILDQDPQTPFRASWESKVEAFVRDCFVPWGNKNYCVVTPTHLPVARALEDKGLLRRIVSSLNKQQIAQEPHYAALLAVNPNWTTAHGPFGVYEMVSPQLIEWVHARLLA